MKPLVKVPVKYGTIAGFLGSVLVVILYYIYPSRHPFLIDIIFDFRIFLFSVFIFFTLKEFRDFYQHGILYFWQGMIASFLFTGTFAFIASVVVLIFGYAVPEFLTSYIDLSTERLKGLPNEVIEQIGKDAYDRNLALIPSTNEFDLASLYFFQSFMIGLFISIILSLILRRQPKTL